MIKQLRAKQERVIEAVRHGLEGEAAVEFVRESGYAMTMPGIARHLRAMGGRGRIQELIDAGYSNVDILEQVFPEEDFSHLRSAPPMQAELFEDKLIPGEIEGEDFSDSPLYDTRKMAIKVPADLFEAIRLAAKAEHKSQNQLIVEILTAALSQMPRTSLLDDEGG